MKIRILWLYPKDMNIYGDYGNILVIEKRLKWRGVESEIIKYNCGDDFPENIDLVIGGGGQDSGQSRIKDDLLLISGELHDLAKKNVPMLVICGLYQLFGDDFRTISGEVIHGIGILSGLKTVGGDERMIGNIVEKSDEFGEIIGFENHSGQTYLNENSPLAKVISGAGNNVDGEFEGARFRNVIGTYLHGSVLPKNPRLADFLIEHVFANRNETFPDWADYFASRAASLDYLTNSAREIAKKRPR